MKLVKTAIAGVISLAFAGVAFAADITGAGATFPAPVYNKWADAYQKATGAKVNYQGIGSSGGIKQITAKTVDFGASDMPLKDDELNKDGLLQFPTVIGGVVPVINLPGVKAGELVLTGQVLGDIYLGKVKKWNDPAIAKLNPKAKLPDQDILVVRRADGSGTSFIFTNYLSKVNAEWKGKVGEGTTVNWPTGTGGKGNEGVAAFVQRLGGAIGYVEYAYAKQNHMTHVNLQNASGAVVQPTSDAFKAAAAGADWNKSFYQILTKPAGQGRMADRRRHLHPGAQDPGQAGPGHRSPEVLRLGLQERRQGCLCPGLRAAAGSGAEPDPRHLEIGCEGRCGQADLQLIAAA